MTQLKTIEQQRAAYALAEIQTLLKDSKVNRKEFRSYANALPAMIHMNGLGQALAFCCAKGDTYGTLYGIVGKWLTRANQPLAVNQPEEGESSVTQPTDSSSKVMENLTQVDMYHYRVAQAEAMALMEWVRKFAVAFMVDVGQAQVKPGEEEGK